MSSRRRAALRRSTIDSRQDDGVPPALADRNHPAWSEARHVLKVLGQWIDPAEDGVVMQNLPSSSALLLHRCLSRWAAERQFLDQHGRPDLHRINSLTTAMKETPWPRPSPFRPPRVFM